MKYIIENDKLIIAGMPKWLIRHIYKIESNGLENVAKDISEYVCELLNEIYKVEDTE